MAEGSSFFAWFKLGLLFLGFFICFFIYITIRNWLKKKGVLKYF